MKVRALERRLGLVRARAAALIAVGSSLVLGVGPLQAASTRFESCPRSDRTVPTTALPGAVDELVPAGATGALLCRYRGLDPSAKRFRLIAFDKVTKASTVARLRAQLDALPPSPAGPTGCPADFGTSIVAYFYYPGASDDIVTVGTSGCTLVSNGHVHRSASLAPGPQLVRELEAMTR